MLPYRKVLWVVGFAAVASGAGFGIYRLASGKQAPAFRFTTVARGSIQALVSATGTLQAVTTVSVGTQVSGQISELLVDFNDHVKKGQLLARIDPTIAQQGVADAQANLEKVQAQANQARSDQNRNRALSTAGLIAGSALEQGGSTQQVADATVRSAGVALDRAKQNLSFTSIYAPIDGVVVERNVNLGQTVAASLSAPQLFLIANDLSRMQILALVGESDIVRIKQGQAVTFTVQALPGAEVPGHRPAGAPAVHDGGQRRELHGRRDAGESRREAPPRDDGPRRLPRQVGRERPQGAERGPALQAERRRARPVRNGPASR